MGGVGAMLAALLASPAAADKKLDVQILQTASSLEILAVATYGAALTLPFIKNGNAVVKKFAQTTRMQHDEHRQAFQAQTKTLGGKKQTKPNPKYAAVVTQMKPTLKTPADVVKLAATLETVATETYLSDLAQLSDTTSKELFASVMGVECQHLATLRAVGALARRRCRRPHRHPDRRRHAPGGGRQRGVPRRVRTRDHGQSSAGRCSEMSEPRDFQLQSAGVPRRRRSHCGRRRSARDHQRLRAAGARHARAGPPCRPGSPAVHRRSRRATT